MSVSRFVWAVCSCGAVLLAGCAKSEPPPPVLPDTAPFDGKVSLDGEPLPNAVVTFLSLKPGVAVFNPTGTTDEEGHYELQIVTKQVTQSGAVPGDYKVTVNRVAPPPKPDEPVEVMTVTLPARYSDAFKTELKVTVPESGGTKDFELKSK